MGLAHNKSNGLYFQHLRTQGEETINPALNKEKG
jgi:hypothetical protein